MLFNITNLIIWLLYYVIYVLVHVMYWVTTFLCIIHMHTHMLFSMTGAVSCRCGICISRSPPVPNEVRVLHPYIFYMHVLTILHFIYMQSDNSCSPANGICWLKPTENKAYCIVLYCIVKTYNRHPIAHQGGRDMGCLFTSFCSTFDTRVRKLYFKSVQ